MTAEMPKPRRAIAAMKVKNKRDMLVFSNQNAGLPAGGAATPGEAPGEARVPAAKGATGRSPGAGTPPIVRC